MSVNIRSIPFCYGLGLQIEKFEIYNYKKLPFDTLQVPAVLRDEFGAGLFEMLVYVTSMEDIKEGLNRIKEALKKLS